MDFHHEFNRFFSLCCVNIGFEILKFSLFIFSKGFLIVFATIAGSFCAEPVNVEVSTPQSVKEAQPQKRAILNDCDGPLGLVGGLQSDIGVSGDLALGLHGPAYAPSYSSGYLASGGISPSYSSGYLASGAISPTYSSGYLASSGVLGSLGHIGAVGHVGSYGAVVAPSSIISSGYAAQAPVLASSVYSSPVLSHPSVIAAPAVSCN